MFEVTREQVEKALVAVGIQVGDSLLVHSAVQYLGRPTGGVGIYLDAILAVISPGGTLAVPTFNFAFARGEAYDPLATPSQGMGAFSEYVRKHSLARRTPHPMQSLAVLGYYAGDLASRDTPSAFDPHSAFARMLELDFKALLLGADVNAISMLHYCEQRANVPYRYWKEFTGPVRTPDGWDTRTYRMFVRDLEIDARLSLVPVQQYLEARGQWSSVPLSYGRVSACYLRDFVSAVDHFLCTDPWSLVTNH